MAAKPETVVKVLLDRYGHTYAEDAGIRLADKPAPLYQLLVLATLLSARITADIAVQAARELFAAGYTTPRAMREASWRPGRRAGPGPLPPLRRADGHDAGRRGRAAYGPVGR